MSTPHDALLKRVAAHLTRFNGTSGYRDGEQKLLDDVNAYLSQQAEQAPADPMDWPLPCDITIGAGTIKAGCKLRTLVARTKALYLFTKAYGPKSLQYDIEHPNDGLNGDAPVDQAPAGHTRLADISKEMDSFISNWKTCSIEEMKYFANELRAALAAQPVQAPVVPDADHWKQLAEERFCEIKRAQKIIDDLKVEREKWLTAVVPDSVLSFEEIEALYKLNQTSPISFARDVESAVLQRIVAPTAAQPAQNLIASLPTPEGCPRPYDGCTCSCHHMPGTRHIMPCCGPSLNSPAAQPKQDDARADNVIEDGSMYDVDNHGAFDDGDQPQGSDK